jgi:hypothetical protein
LSSTDTGFATVVQMQQYEWIVSHLVLGLAFVFLEENTSSSFVDDCRGMNDLFLVKYRIPSVGAEVSVIPPNSFPPFAGQLQAFRNLWSVDHCEMIFNSIWSILTFDAANPLSGCPITRRLGCEECQTTCANL